ncbi:MAG: hypothetical protein AAGB04_01395 [Pseudomonadota bacterium]
MRDIIYGPDGNAYVASIMGKVVRYNGTTGAFIDNFVPEGTGGLSTPTGLTFGPDGNLYVGDFGSNAVLRYKGETGEFVDVFASGAGLNNPNPGLEFGPDGNLYVTSTDSASNGVDQILRYDGTTGAFIDVFVEGNNFDFVFGPDQNLYATEFFNDRVIRYDGEKGDFIDAFTTAVGTGGEVRGLTFGPDGDLYVVRKSNEFDGVTRFNGVTGKFIGNFAPTGRQPWGITFSPRDLSATGDYDGDGDVDGTDFLNWQIEDGSVGGLSDWRDSYGSAALQSSIIPEPTSLITSAIGLWCILGLGRRRTSVFETSNRRV